MKSKNIFIGVGAIVSILAVAVIVSLLLGTIIAVVLGVTLSPQRSFAPEPLSLNKTTPTTLCAEIGQQKTLALKGTGFLPTTVVKLRKGTIEINSISTAINGKDLEVTFSSQMESGKYNIVAKNVHEVNETVSTFQVEVFPIVLVFLVNPPTVYNGINSQATVYTSGLGENPQSISMLNGLESNSLNFTVEKSNKFLVTIPKNRTRGFWNVKVTSVTGCSGTLQNKLLITDNISVRINISYYQAKNPLGPGKVGFNTPLVYLTADGSINAISMRAVELKDQFTITGVVPKGTKVGTYSVIVVNADGTVGILLDTLKVTKIPPPRVFAVEPSSIVSNAPTPATIIGENFNNVSYITMDCQIGATSFSANATITDRSSSTKIRVVFPGGAPDFALCLVTVFIENGNNFRYSAISVKKPSANLKPWSNSNNMKEKRRAFGLTAGRSTLSSRFLYAFGGDNSTKEFATDTVESVPVDIFGNVQTWSYQRYKLPIKLTQFQAVTVGRYIYAVGGIIVDNGTETVSNRIYRAQILNPIVTPIADISIDLISSGSNLTEGVWYYKVSAVFPKSFEYNPDGESLPGELVVINVPKISGIVIILTWKAIPNAVGYRVYRTSSPNQSSNNLKFLVQVSTTTYSDAGLKNENGTSPLPSGSLSQWYLMPHTLNTAREMHSVIAVPSINKTDVFHIYTIGGRDSNGTYLNSYEISNITVTPESLTSDEIQTSTPWKNGQYSFPARAELSSVIIGNNDFDKVISGTYWLYIGPGRNNGGFDKSFRAQQVGASGEIIAPWINVNNLAQGDISGYCLQQGSGDIYYFGGSSGGPSATGSSAQLCSVQTGACNTAVIPPDNKGFNSLGISMSTSRVNFQCVQESALFFVAGGTTTGGGASNTVESTVK
eukprot:gene1359-11441_t